MNRTSLVLLLALLTSGCGELTGRSPVRLVIDALNASSAGGGTSGSVLQSDVAAAVGRPAADFGQVQLSLVLRDQGPNAGPSDLNQVTITRYRVSYRRTDGRAVPGVDVPYAFDSAFTVTVPVGGTATAGFVLVRNTAKAEAPLLALASNGEVIFALADLTFYGQDLAGNDVSATGSIGITFANFAD